MAVGEEGSIALASDRVNVSSPSISSAITQLEEEFGLSLFVRKHAHGLTLSQAGQQFMAQARAVLAEADALNRLGGTISGKVQGPLNIGCLVTFAQVVLPALRRDFQDRFPDVTVRQFELNQVALVDGLRRTKRTPSLGGLGREERERALISAVSVHHSRKDRIAGRHIILVDDVLTSGATSDACVAALLDAGAASAKIACFARVVDGRGVGGTKKGSAKSETPEAITTPGAT